MCCFREGRTRIRSCSNSRSGTGNRVVLNQSSYESQTQIFLGQYVNALQVFYSGGVINHLFSDLEISVTRSKTHSETADGNITQGTRLDFRTANRIRVEPCHYHPHNDSSAQADSAMPSGAVVSPAYQTYPVSSGQYTNSRLLPVPDWMMRVHLLRSA